MAVRGLRGLRGAGGGLVVLLLALLVAAQLVAEAEGKASSSASSPSALCSKFPSFCDEGEQGGADDRKGKSAHQRFAETKWRKPKGDTEIRGHLAPKKPFKSPEQAELDDAAALRAATIREAEERMRLVGDGAGRAGGAASVETRTTTASFDKRRTVEDARRKAHLIQEARRKRRQRLEEEEAEDEEEDEMVVEVEEEDEDDDDEAVVEDDESAEDDEDDEDEDSEELASREEAEEEYVEESTEEEAADEEEGEEEGEEDAESGEVIGKYEDEPEDEEDRLAQRKLREAVLRRRKWKEEEARMKQREEERKRVEEEKRKREEEVRKRRIEEMRKRKRQLEEEAERRREQEEEEERKREEEEAERRRQEEEEELRRKKEEARKMREEEERREQLQREERQREEKRRREEEEERQKQMKVEAEAEERQRIEEENRKKEEEESQRLRAEKRLRDMEEEEKKREDARREAERVEEKKKREEEEKRVKLEKEQRRKAEEEERRVKLEREQRKRAEEEEGERKRKAEEDERRIKLAEEEKRKRKLEDEEKAREKQKEIEEEKLRKKKQAEEEKKKLAAELEEKHRKQLLEDEKKVKEEKEAQKASVRAAKDDDGEKDTEGGERTPEDEDDQTSWMSGFPEFFAPTADDDVKNEECKKHSRIFVQHLAKYKTWALNMYDATAKLPSGVLSGNAIQFGDFDECLGVDVRLRQRSAAASASSAKDEEGEDAAAVSRAVSWLAELVRPVLEPVLGAREEPGLVHIRGRYCLAGLELEARRSDPALRAALDRALAYSFVRGSLNDSSHFVQPFRTLGWGVCVPEACAARDVERALRGAVARFQRSGAWAAGLVRARVAVPPSACRLAPPRDRPLLHRLPPAFLAACGAAALLLLLAAAATLRDSGHEPDELGGLAGVLACFSLRRNWSALAAPDDPGADDIRCMHGVRSVCSLLLYAAHKVLVIAALPFSNRGQLTLLAATPGSLLLRGSLMYTDTFLLLSGALAAFHLSRQLGRGGGLDWVGRLATRVIRLTPTLGIVTVTYAFVLEHVGSGPLWGQLVEENGRICREHMWRNLLYVSNFWPFEQMCAPHTHQLALDMQLSLLVPPLVWLLVKAWPVASPLVVGLVGASAWLRQRAALQHRVSLLIYSGVRPADLYRAADESYILAPHRASAYLTGVALGYLLHRVPRKLHIPKAALLPCWLACAALAGWALFSQRHVARLDYRFDADEAARFNALAPLAWAAAMSWLIFACHTGNGGWLDRLLCARPLVLLSRISYAFYLVQFPVFFYNAGSVRSQKEFSVTAALDLWELLLVLALATLVTLLVEMPMQSVRSALASSKRRQSLKWEPQAAPPSPTSPQELAAAYYYNPGLTDAYTSRPKVE